MLNVLSMLRALWTDDGGQDLIEYALLAAIISIAGVVALTAFGGKMRAGYLGWDTAQQAAWVPCRPAPASCP